MTILASILLSCFLVSTGLAQSPNVVFINVDDLGYRDLGYTGSRYYETPNIDRLAREGMVFTQAYAGAANCAPSRACLMSGRNTPSHSIYTVESSERGDTRTRKIIPTANQTILADSIYTLAELFQDQGYVTATIGKWHLSKNPKTQGFDVNIGGSKRGNPGQNGYFSPYNIDNLPDGPEGEYLTDRLTTEAVQFLGENQHKPFFLYVPYYTVHTPLISKKALIDKFRHKKTSDGQDNPIYAAMVASLDENIGRLLTRLDQLQLSEKTIVVFTSDNGGIRDVSYQDPLRAGKGSYYEGGIRVPLIIRWPGKISPKTTSNTPVSNLDFYPTFQTLVGSETSQNKALDGVDIGPLLEGKEIAERSLFWHFPVYLQAYNPQEDGGRDPLFRTRPGSVVRRGNWKLHHYYEDDSLELYHLEKDTGETTNVADHFPEIMNELHQLLQKWLQDRAVDVVFSPNPSYDKTFEQQQISNALRQ